MGALLAGGGAAGPVTGGGALAGSVPMLVPLMNVSQYLLPL
jgi:hypothetical protein